MFKKKRIFDARDPRKKKTIAAFYDKAGNHVPGLQGGYVKLTNLDLSVHVDAMLEAATQIAAAFDHIRVDFIDLHDAPALGELTCCSMNARIRYSSDALEALARNAVLLDLPEPDTKNIRRICRQRS